MSSQISTTRLMLGMVIFLQLYTVMSPYDWSLTVRDGRLLSTKSQATVQSSRKFGTFDQQLPLTSQQTSKLSEELLDPWSVTRLLSDHVAMVKALKIVSEEELNVDLSEKFSSQLQALQMLLSRAPTLSGGLAKEEVDRVLRRGSALLYEARELHYDSASHMMKLKGQLSRQANLTEEANMKATFYGQLAAESLPKGLHCLNMILTLEAPKIINSQLAGPLQTNRLYHFCIFSDNVMAVAAVVKSTVTSSKDPSSLLFHIVTDAITEKAMQSWFYYNPPSTAGVEVQKVEDFSWLNASYVPVLKQMQDEAAKKYYFKASAEEAKSAMKFHNPKYVAILNHLRFYLPDIFPNLTRVVFLDDDVIVQKDLAPLFHLDLKGNVNGAVETCLESFHRFYKYLNFSHPLINRHLDPEGCGWAYGMNVFDLKAWRREGLTERYHYWQQQNVNHTLWQLGTLPPGLLTFHGLTLPLDRSWHVLGLGYNDHVDLKEIENGAVIHWNGNMKPWLKLGISRYNPFWDKYIDFDERHLQKCNVV